jgi:hypothetical protein
MSAAVWNEPAMWEKPGVLPGDGRRDVCRLVGGNGRDAVVPTVLITVLAPRRPAGEGLPRVGEPSPAETA